MLYLTVRPHGAAVVCTLTSQGEDRVDPGFSMWSLHVLPARA